MQKKVRWAHIVCFALLFGLCWLFIYSGDDWAWGSSIGLNRLEKHFQDYNGRYLGNLTAIALTRSRLLRAFVMAVCFTGIACCAEYLTRAKWAFSFCVCMLALMPSAMFRQVASWTSGFSNYSISVFLFLLAVCLLDPFLHTDTQEPPGQSMAAAAALLVLGLIGTLFIEHLTVCHVAICVILPVVTFRRFRRVYVQQAAYLAGCLAGTVLMFSNSAYRSFSSEDSGRNIAQGLTNILKRMWTNYKGKIYKEAVLQNVWLGAALALCCVCLFVALKRQLGRNQRLAMEICLAVICVFAGYMFLAAVQLGDAGRTGLLYGFERAGAALWFLALLLFAVLAGFACRDPLNMLFLAGCMLAVTAPLFLVTPIGDRCFFVLYVLYILLACRMIALHPPDEEKLRVIRRGSAVLAAAMYLLYAYIFFCNDRAEQNRLAYIREQAAGGELEITVSRLPYEDYVWMGTPGTGKAAATYEKRYKLFYGLPQEITLKPKG